ncbi:MAG: hypothetical protein H7833_15240 [Magnetococcus sp. DMHC-1]|nr:hypothetical protein [Magnetococcales bacterium]
MDQADKNIAQLVSESFRRYVDSEVYYGWALVAFLLIIALVLALYLVKLHKQEAAREAKRMEKAAEKAARRKPPPKPSTPNILVGTRQARQQSRHRKS